METHVNKEISSVLYEIGMYYDLSNDEYRKKAFLNGAEIISNLEDEVDSSDDIKNIPGIGKSISEVVDEFLTTKNVKRLDQLRDKHKNEMATFQYFQSFYGIGPATALKLVRAGYTELPQIYDDRDKLLTKAQQIGIYWRNHITVRIPRKEMNIINQKISDVLDHNNVNWVMAGSYRREEPSSGDIDLLIEDTDEITIDKIYELLGSYIPDVLAKGKKKLAGIFRLSDEYWGHRIDILMFKKENWAFALMHFTGSGQFNKLMRNRAKSFGWKLSEYNLIDENGNKIVVNDEKDIFEALKVKYLEPIERTKTLNLLELDY